jgi:hypothetical protein
MEHIKKNYQIFKNILWHINEYYCRKKEKYIVKIIARFKGQLFHETLIEYRAKYGVWWAK